MKSKIAFLDQKMAISVESGIVLRLYDDLMYILFDKPYCLLHFTGNSRYIIQVPLQFMADNLPKDVFMKCKRSAILNVRYCKELKKTRQTVVMDDGTEIKLTQQNALNFKWMIENMSGSSPPCKCCRDNEIEKQVHRKVRLNKET